MSEKMNLPPMDVSTAINFVTKIVSNLSQCPMRKKTRKIQHYCHIDIELISEDKYCWVQITNNGVSKLPMKKLLTLDFNDPTLNGRILGTIILKESKGNKESVYKTHFDGNFIQLSSGHQNFPNATKFSHLKDCLSIKIEHPFEVKDVPLLVDPVVEYLITFRSIYPQTKYTLRTDKETYYNNFTELDDDYAKCKILGSALETVVLQSVNENFRKEICETLNIPHVNDAFEAIMCNLLPSLHKNYQL